MSFLIEEGSSEPIVQQTELLGYLFKLLAPDQVIWFIEHAKYEKLREGYAGLMSSQQVANLVCASYRIIILIGKKRYM